MVYEMSTAPDIIGRTGSTLARLAAPSPSREGVRLPVFGGLAVSLRKPLPGAEGLVNRPG